jgi:hypothetical protein
MVVRIRVVERKYLAEHDLQNLVKANIPQVQYPPLP